MKHNLSQSLQHDALNLLQPLPPTAVSEPTAKSEKDDDHNDLLRTVQVLGSWLSRRAASGQLTTTMEAILAKLDDILERLKQDRTSGQLMSIKAAAQYLSLSERTIRERIALRQWPAYRSGNAVRVDPIELKALMAKECR
jgi:excisionase family DNA binding protein